MLIWSEWRGSNPRPDGPKPPALPTALHPAMKLKFCCDCGQSCGQCWFSVHFYQVLKSRKRRRCKAFRRFCLLRLGYRHGTPKPPALPTALHPVMPYSNTDPDIIQHLPRPRKQKNSMGRRPAAPCYFLFNFAQSRTMTEIPFGMTVRLCLPMLCASSSAASSDGA